MNFITIIVFFGETKSSSWENSSKVAQPGTSRGTASSPEIETTLMNHEGKY